MKSPHHEHEDQTAELAETRLLENGGMLELSSGNFVTPVEITLAPNADHPAVLTIYLAENLQKNTDGSPCLFAGEKSAGAFHGPSCYRKETFDPEAAYVIVSEADVSATQDDAGFIMLYAGQTITIGREQAGSLSSLRENPYVSRGHLILSVDEKTGGLTIEDTSTNGTQVKFMPDSPWDNLCEAPTGSPESLSSDGLPSLAVPYPSAAEKNGDELPSQGELMDEMPHRVKELLEWRSRAIDFVEEQVEGMLSALHKNDSSKLKWHLNKIGHETSSLTSIANTGSELLSTTLASSVDNETRELLKQSQEMYKYLLDSLKTLLTCMPTDSMGLSAYNSQVEFRRNIAGVKESTGGIRAVDRKLIHRFNQEG